MVTLPNKNDPSRYVVVAENKSDMEFLEFLYHSKIVFGMYKIYNIANDKSHTSGEYKFLAKNFPLATGLAFINEVSNFVPKQKED